MTVMLSDGENCMAVMLRWGRWENLYSSNAQMGKMGKTVWQ